MDLYITEKECKTNIMKCPLKVDNCEKRTCRPWKKWILKCTDKVIFVKEVGII